MSHDFFQRRVPNWLVLTGAAGATVALILGNQPFGVSWLAAVSGGAAVFAGFLAAYALRLMGAGDVKFAAVLGLWIGIKPIFIVWLGSSLLAGIHALTILALQKWPLSPGLSAALGAVNLDHAGERRIKNTPYAAYMAITSVVWAMFLR